MYLHSLVLENVKGFKEIALDFQRPDGSYAGFNVIVGGNASGKTTILRAMALALCGPTFGRQIVRNGAGWIRKGQKSSRMLLRIHWDPGVDLLRKRGRAPAQEFPCGVRWIAEAEDEVPSLKEIEQRTLAGTRLLTNFRGPWDPNVGGWFAVGYGAFRRLTGSSPEAMRDAAGGGKASRFVSLFREDVALSESEGWLKEWQFKALEGSEDARILVDQIMSFLNDGLLPSNFTISRVTSDHVYMRTVGDLELPMRDLSDGYRSVYSLIVDIVRHMADVYGTASLFSKNEKGQLVLVKPGVILIDEIEDHLHPSWQRTICDWLKTRFPNIQFFVATHSPLIVQGADLGGIFVLPLPTEKREARRLSEREWQRIVLGKAEKVLLGEAFGLSHTRSEWAICLINRFRKLEAKEKAGALRQPEEKEEFSKLQQEMKLVFEDEPGEATGETVSTSTSA